jgi:hypothetical protein
VQDWKVAALRRLDLLPAGGDDATLPAAAQVHIGAEPHLVPGRLLGAVRVLLCQEDARAQVEACTVEQLCEWDTPLARQHEVSGLDAAVGQCVGAAVVQP